MRSSPEILRKNLQKISHSSRVDVMVEGNRFCWRMNGMPGGVASSILDRTPGSLSPQYTRATSCSLLRDVIPVGRSDSSGLDSARLLVRGKAQFDDRLDWKSRSGETGVNYLVAALHDVRRQSGFSVPCDEYRPFSWAAHPTFRFTESQFTRAPRHPSPFVPVTIHKSLTHEHLPSRIQQ